VDEQQLRQSRTQSRRCRSAKSSAGHRQRRIVVRRFLARVVQVAYQLALSDPRPLAGSSCCRVFSDGPHDQAARRQPRAADPGSVTAVSTPVVPEELGHQAHQTLLAMGYADRGYKTYPIGHNVSPEEIGRRLRWLRATLGLTSQMTRPDAEALAARLAEHPDYRVLRAARRRR